MKTIPLCLFPTLLLFVTVVSAQEGDPALTEVWEPVPVVVTPGDNGSPPSDAIVLFDGSSLDQWQLADGRPATWDLANGVMTVRPNPPDGASISTRQAFGDVQLHLEWRSPPEDQDEGQNRGNSGVYLMGLYEVQVLNSFDGHTYPNGQAASVYKQHIPLVNAMRPTGEWQAYDIIFHAPRFDADGALLKPAFLTVLHNGVLVQDHVALRGPTVYIGEPAYQAHAHRLPLVLQDHGDLVSFRNIWIRELD